MNTSFGEKLKEARSRKKLKQSDLAKQLGVKNTTISNWENNISKPDLDMLSYICGALDVKVSYFLEATLPEDEISIKELDHIKKYRRLPDRDRELVDQHMERALEVADQADQLQAENQQLQNTVDQLQAALASREEPAEPPAPEYDHLTVIAAHNDHATEPGQLELMRQDVEMIKKMAAEKRKK